MFSFFKKKKEPQRGPLLKVDLHSHLIPGIDDGSQSLKESMKLIRKLHTLGYEKLITTPHIMSDAYRNSAENIYNGLALLREEIEKEQLPVRIDAAAEYYLDDGFFDEMKKPRILSIGGKYLLFETSYFSKPLHIEEMIFAIGAAGYQPIMAHPERYRYIKDPEKEYTRLKDLGVFFQINLNSFGGHYGRQAKHLAGYLSQAGMIDFLGSDTHHMKQVETLEKVFYLDAYHEIFTRNTIKNNDLID
jgi:tyrosine-protein phosphatase YwqE